MEDVDLRLLLLQNPHRLGVPFRQTKDLVTHFTWVNYWSLLTESDNAPFLYLKITQTQ